MISKIEILQVREAIKFSKLKTVIRILTRHKLCVFECTLLKRVMKFRRFLRTNILGWSRRELDLDDTLREYALLQIMRKLQMLDFSKNRLEALRMYIVGNTNNIPIAEIGLFVEQSEQLAIYILGLENKIETGIREPATHSMLKHKIAFAYPLATIKRLQSIREAERGETITVVDKLKRFKNKKYICRLYEELGEKP